MKKFFCLYFLFVVQISLFSQDYYPEGTKWTELRLDTLKYDSWYSKVGDEWVPNFETIEYYVKGKYNQDNSEYFRFKLVYTNGLEWSDSLTLLISESQWGIEVSVAIFNEDGVPLYPGKAYMFDDWREGYILSYQTIDGANIPSLPAVGIKDYGTISEIKEGYFGGENLLKYVDLNGIRIIHGIGVTEWNDGECIFGPVDPYSCYYGTYPGMPETRNYRSMLVHFERNGEVLYDVWPEKGVSGIFNLSAPQSKHDSTIYDLQGRKLQQAPLKGVYIQKGKKVAVN